MNTIFKRHDKVKLLVSPNIEYIEYTPLNENEEKIEIKRGAIAEVNILLPNGQYHLVLRDKSGNPKAFFPMNEEDLEAA